MRNTWSARIFPCALPPTTNSASYSCRRYQLLGHLPRSCGSGDPTRVVLLDRQPHPHEQSRAATSSFAICYSYKQARSPCCLRRQLPVPPLHRSLSCRSSRLSCAVVYHPFYGDASTAPELLSSKGTYVVRAFFSIDLPLSLGLSLMNLALPLSPRKSKS